MGPSQSRQDTGTMPFKKFAQIGRVVYLIAGKYKGKLAVIVDIIDTNRALVEGPCNGVPRQEMKFCEMHLTAYLLKIGRSQKTRYLRAAWEKAKITERFHASKWNKNLQRAALREKMNDFDRFKLGRTKQARNKIIADAFVQVKTMAGDLKRQQRIKKLKASRKRFAAKGKLVKAKDPKKKVVKKRSVATMVANKLAQPKPKAMPKKAPVKKADDAKKTDAKKKPAKKVKKITDKTILKLIETKRIIQLKKKAKASKLTGGKVVKAKAKAKAKA